MAAAEVLEIARGIDDKVEGVDERVKNVDMKVESIDDKVRGVDSKVHVVDDKVKVVDSRLKGVDNVVKDVDHKVGSVIKGVMETRVAILQVVNQVSDLNRNELRKDLQKWIAPPDPSVNYNTACAAHHEGTAAWCTEGNPLADWKTSGSLLWIHGKPGSGKSILSSVIIRDIKLRDIKLLSNNGSACLAYFFF
jgi:hypothetical protein